MTKILFIQGIHNFSLREQFVKDVKEATGLEVVYFPYLYGLMDTDKQLELIGKVNAHIAGDDSRYIILAHSFGGILAYCLEEKTYEKVEQIITFGAPHQVQFAWFKDTLSKLPYRTEVDVPLQKSCGFYFDFTVPFFFTRHPHAKSHTNHIGSHTSVPNRKKFFRKLILGHI